MKEFIKQHENDQFRYWIRKRVWTPYEQELKDPNQSDLVDEECDFGYIVEGVDLGSGDWLIGISYDRTNDHISYYKLSEIDFALCACDQEN